MLIRRNFVILCKIPIRVKEMKLAKGIGIFILALMFFLPGCKRGVESASEPLKRQAEEHYIKARRLFLTCDPDKYADAVKEFQTALNYWDEYPEALAGLAETISMWRGYALTEEEFGQAYQLAQRSLRLKPELADGYRAMADLFRHRGETDRALRMIENALKIAPDNAENLYVKGSALLDKDPKESARVLIQAQKLNPNLAKIYFNLASAAHKLNNFDEALKNLQRYQEMVPSDVASYCSMGMIYLSKMQMENTAEAREQLESKAMENLKMTIAKSDAVQKPWQAQWVILSAKTLARIYMDKKNYPEALNYLKKSEEIFAEDAELHYLYGKVYKAMGDKAQAKAHLEQASKLAPDNEDIKKELKGL